MRSGFNYKMLTLVAGVLVALIILVISFSLPGPSTAMPIKPVDPLSLGKETAAIAAKYFSIFD